MIIWKKIYALHQITKNGNNWMFTKHDLTLSLFAKFWRSGGYWLVIEFHCRVINVGYYSLFLAGVIHDKTITIISWMKTTTTTIHQTSRRETSGSIPTYTNLTPYSNPTKRRNFTRSPIWDPSGIKTNAIRVYCSLDPDPQNSQKSLVEARGSIQTQEILH